jgi:hypothetical protein
MKNLFNPSFVIALLLLAPACSQKTESTEQSAPANDQMVATSNPAASTTEAPATEGNFGAFQFESLEHDFGTIKEGEIVKHLYKFKNVGNAPLIVSDVKPQCGCTATNWTKDPVQPGGQGEIEVQFDSNGRAGQNSKSTTVTANTKEGTAMLYFKVNVAGKPAGGPPLRQ